MSTSDTIVTFESGDFDLDDISMMGSTSLCRVCMDQDYYTSKCRQIKILPRFGWTGNKHFLYCSTNN